MIIRRMKIGDVPEVLRIGVETEGFKVSDQPGDIFWSEEQLYNWVNSDDILLVAEDESKIVGFVLTTHHKPTSKVTWENQVVLPEFRNKGIATALIIEMEKLLKDKGATYLHFLVREDNLAMNFYKDSFDEGYKFVWFSKKL